MRYLVLIISILTLISVASYANAKTGWKWVCSSGAEGDEGIEVRVNQKNKAYLYVIDPSGKKLMESYQTKEFQEGELATYTGENFELRIGLEEYYAQVVAQVEGALPFEENLTCRKD